jgi:membrane associated rhomboid family serine protease
VDLNHIFLFIALISSLLVLARAWRPGGIFRGWRVAAIIVLAITGTAWIFCRDYAGFVGGGAWFALLFLPMVGLRRASQLAAAGRYRSAARLARALRIFHPTVQLRDQIEIFQRLEAQRGPGPKIDILDSLPETILRRLRAAPAVAFLILANVAVFITELHREALNNPLMLHRLGALDVLAVIDKGELWRLFSALFLHDNLVHIGFNLFALYIIGPPLERDIGKIRFIGCYLISGLGSTAGVVLLTLVKIAPNGMLVGASGCIMGLVGVWVGLLLRHRHAWHAKQRLMNLLLIIVIQILFDVLTPQISMSAHLCGLAAGFGLGLVVRPKPGAF